MVMSSSERNGYFDHSEKDDHDQTLTLRMIAANMPDAAIALVKALFLYLLPTS